MHPALLQKTSLLEEIAHAGDIPHSSKRSHLRLSRAQGAASAHDTSTDQGDVDDVEA